MHTYMHTYIKLTQQEYVETDSKSFGTHSAPNSAEKDGSRANSGVGKPTAKARGAGDAQNSDVQNAGRSDK
jgi:hypothetical protein